MNDYVECAECGHPLERHTNIGCDWQTDGCSCTNRWTQAEIRKVRQLEGLPAAFKSHEF